MSKKRIKKVTLIFIAVILGLAGRLAYIQLAGHEELSEVSYAQQMIELQGADSRAKIYDRNKNVLVGIKKEYVYIFKADELTENAKTILEDLGAEETNSKNKDYVVYTSSEYDKEKGAELINRYGGYILRANRRYEDDQTAVHLIGYINKADEVGAAGIELMCNEQLVKTGKKVFAAADVKGNFLKGKGLVTTGNDEDSDDEEDGVTLTLDSELQKETEKALESLKKPGAVLVLETATGNVLASAGTPTFNPNKIQDYIKSNDNELVNKVTQGEYAPGSVFKIIVLAAALESGIDTDISFYCSGKETLYGRHIGCKSGGSRGHGWISLENAFAQSCNCAFIQLGQKVGAGKILQMAENFGLGQKTTENYPGEKKGQLMTLENCSGIGIGNLSIGQGETLTTPIQVAKVTNIIACGGIDKGIHLLQGSKVLNRRVISEENAQIIQKYMGKVMSSGTGSVMEMPFSCGGKTGSAEAAGENGEVVHSWITGFVPQNEPQYTITVFVENGQLGSESTLPVFSQIVEFLSSSRSFNKAFFSMRET